jgi:hypothetical protein
MLNGHAHREPDDIWSFDQFVRYFREHKNIPADEVLDERQLAKLREYFHSWTTPVDEELVVDQFDVNRQECLVDDERQVQREQEQVASLYVAIPKLALLDSELPDGEFRLYTLLLSYDYNDKRHSFKGREQMSVDLGISISQIDRRLSSLKSKGYIKVDRIGLRLNDKIHTLVNPPLKKKTLRKRRT